MIKKLIKGKHVERVVFNEITKKAVIHGIENPRQIEPLLVDAYMARRALDYLVGFNISPILWTKLPGSKSAGRVQSVALKLITCLLYTSPSPRDVEESRMPSSA